MKKYDDDIFVIGTFANSEEKELILINLINKLKKFNIPILLTGHYPVKKEIQDIVDYYIFDKENPRLTSLDYEEYNVIKSCVWVNTNDFYIEKLEEFRYDYAVWITFRNAFNFVKMLGKKNIHYLDYDMDLDLNQYENEFMLPLNNFDASILLLNPTYSQTYLFSIKTDVVIRIIDHIKTKREYYVNRPTGFLLEEVFYQYLTTETTSIYISKYISNGCDINICNPNNTGKNTIDNFLVCDDDKNLYCYIMPAFNLEFPIEIHYCGIKN